MGIFVYANAIVRILLTLYLFLAPAVMMLGEVSDPALSTGEIPRSTFDWHRQLSGKYEAWARERVASGQAAELSIDDISGTEWPVYGSVFYLWATEALQQAWELDPSLAPAMPKAYARGAIDAAIRLVIDPNHAAWVRRHWGSDYLKRENLFYRMLVISGLTSYERLSGDPQYKSVLSTQVESLSDEIDRSPYGLLDDYPGQCYPVDILPAIAAIRQADSILGTDHSAFAARSLRAFQGSRLDPNTSLPTYLADSKTGRGIGLARGVGLSMMLTWAPELWPETARDWYASYQRHFWQQGWVVAGFREFSKESTWGDWWFDVDAGPVIAGYGTTASAFGIGAARANGQLAQASALSAEALVASWPLPDGTRLGTWLLSNASDAPYVGDAALLFNLTRRPVDSTRTTSERGTPLVAYLAIGLAAAIGMAGIASSIALVTRWHKRRRQADIPARLWQFIVWVLLVGSGLLALTYGNGGIGLALLLLGQFLPIEKGR